jgi:SAM-dependent methyltransferase
VRGRVLDVGVGAGRVALELQRRGHDVVGIDVSPNAVEVSRRRGVRDARVLALADMDDSVGPIDTVVMFGNNFGLFGSRPGATWLLRRLGRLTKDHARLVASSFDPYRTDDAAHLGYHGRNRRRGRMPGQVRIRVRHRTARTRWFDYLFVSPDEMRELAASARWTVRTFIEPDPGSLYVGVLEKG